MFPCFCFCSFDIVFTISLGFFFSSNIFCVVVFFFISVSALLFCCSVFTLYLFLSFFISLLSVGFVSLFILQLAHCFVFVFWFWTFVSFLLNCLISFLGSFVCLVVPLLFDLFGSVFVSFGCMPISLFLFLFVRF